MFRPSRRKRRWQSSGTEGHPRRWTWRKAESRSSGWAEGRSSRGPWLRDVGHIGDWRSSGRRARRNTGHSCLSRGKMLIKLRQPREASRKRWNVFISFRDHKNISYYIVSQVLRVLISHDNTRAHNSSFKTLFFFSLRSPREDETKCIILLTI